MATEQTLTGSGELKESTTTTADVTFSSAQIVDSVNRVTAHIAELQAELAVWQARKTKLEELAG